MSVEADIAALLGAPSSAGIRSADRLKIPCVFQVVALWQPPAGGDRHVMHIGPQTPPSAADALALSVARAQAEAIITTGRILRAEPDVRYVPFGPAAEALLAWRREVLGLATLPQVVVLTGQPLPEHPALASGQAVRALAMDGIAAVKVLQDQGLRSIALEAGPSVAASFYTPGSPLQQLMLSTCHAPALPAEVIGPVLATEAALAATLPHATPAVERTEAGVPWRFQLRWA